MWPALRRGHPPRLFFDPDARVLRLCLAPRDVNPFHFVLINDL